MFCLHSCWQCDSVTSVTADMASQEPVQEADMNMDMNECEELRDVNTNCDSVSLSLPLGQRSPTYLNSPLPATSPDHPTSPFLATRLIDGWMAGMLC